MGENDCMQGCTEPAFIIAGAPRSGTTYLYELCNLHPEIYMARPQTPEPKFFLIDDLYERGIDFYLDTWFSEAPQKMVAGEKSTGYLESPFAAERIHTNFPKMKLIFILRDPVMRAFSNYCWSRMHGFENEEFDVAVATEKEREKCAPISQRYTRPYAYVSRGMYADLLNPYFRIFSKEQILILRFEDIANTPEELAASLHSFLDVEPRPSDVRKLGALNSSKKDGLSIKPETRKTLERIFQEPNQRLSALLGPSFRIWSYE